MTGPNPDHRIRVELGPRSYDIIIAPGALPRLGPLAREALPGAMRILLAADQGLPPEVSTAAAASLTRAGLETIIAPVQADEREKSLGQLTSLLTQMSRLRLSRSDALIALGGGITGDLAGFAAAVYRRGIRFIQCPTTLLAMVDASVGGKTGINLAIDASDSGLRKNIVGAFHQPSLVVADPRSLASLPERHFRAGLAECIKHGMIAADWQDPGLFAWTAQHLGRVLAQDPAALAELVARNIAIKSRIVARDEHEQQPDGGRMLLNLGHTFAHAIETLPGLSPDGSPASAPLHHGEAVALGLIAATATSISLGRCPAPVLPQLKTAIRSVGLPQTVASLPDDRTLLGRMGDDKKAIGSTLRLVLPIELGRAAIVSDPPSQAIAAGWAAIRAQP